MADCSVTEYEAPRSNQSSRSGPTELVEGLWQRLQPLLPNHKRGGRPYSHERRLLVEAIVYQMQTGCAWNELPSHFPPYQTVHAQLRKWQKTGVWAKAWDGLVQPRPSG
jgi:transposase